jgi:hypothetical protein
MPPPSYDAYWKNNRRRWYVFLGVFLGWIPYGVLVSTLAGTGDSVPWWGAVPSNVPAAASRSWSAVYSTTPSREGACTAASPAGPKLILTGTTPRTPPNMPLNLAGAFASSKSSLRARFAPAARVVEFAAPCPPCRCARRLAPIR